MRTIGKVETVDSEIQRMKIGFLGLAETRWSGKGDFDTDAGSTVIYSGSESRKESGVAMILDKERSRSLMGYNPVNSRILTVRLSGCPWNLTLIQIYAPTNQADDQEKENFYTCLQQVYQQVPKQDIVLLSGDFNAKIGTRAPIGKHALGSQNDNGERLVQFAQANDLVTANAIVRQHVRQMYTWKSHDGAHRNQIDYTLVQMRWWTSVRKCKSYPGADAGSDHILVGMKFGIKLHKLPKRTVCIRDMTFRNLRNTQWNFKTGSKQFRRLSPTTQETWQQNRKKVKIVELTKEESIVNGIP